MKIVCWECSKEAHSMGCDSRSRIDALQHFLDNLHNVPNDVLNYVSHKIYVESLERKLRFDEYVEAPQELEIKHDNAKRN